VETYYVVEPCASSKAFEIKFKDKKLDLKKAELVGNVLATTPAVLVAKFEDAAISIYASGRIMMKGVEGKKAEQLANKLVALLQQAGAIL
jgi:ribonuclease HIII